MSDYTPRNENLDQMLDDLYPEVQIGSLTFSPSRIVYELDPTAYRTMASDFWLDDDEDDEAS